MMVRSGSDSTRMRFRVTDLHVTLSERVRRVSRRVSQGYVDRTLLGVRPSFWGFFDSLRSLRMTGQWEAPRLVLWRSPNLLQEKLFRHTPKPALNPRRAVDPHQHEGVVVLGLEIRAVEIDPRFVPPWAAHRRAEGGAVAAFVAEIGQDRDLGTLVCGGRDAIRMGRRGPGPNRS